MKFKHISIFLLIILLIFSGCENPTNSKSNDVKINLSISFADNIQKLNNLQKTTNITHVNIAVTGNDMDEINENFNVSNNRVEVELSVPKGDGRKFTIRGIDQEGRLQFVGTKTININDSEVDVIINDIEILVPNPVNLSIDNINDTGFELNWTKTNANDFAFYRVLVSRTPILDPDDHGVMEDIGNIDRTHAIISGADPDTDYFVAVITVDTENFFGGVLEFGVPGSIVQRVRTESGGSGSFKPLNIGVVNISSSIFGLIWSKSSMPDFNFYRVLISEDPNLDPGEDQIGDDIHDINQNKFHIFDLEENSIYFTTVLNMNNQLEFPGSLEFGAEQSIVKKVTTAEQFILFYDDETNENIVDSYEPGGRLMNKFSAPTESTYISGVWLALNDNSGQNGNYRLVICDENRNDILRTEPLETTDGGTWVGWNNLWENYSDGFVSSDFYIGIEYTKSEGWPEVFLDESTDKEAGYYVDPAGNWKQLGELEYFGNLMIQVVVDINGREGKVNAENNNLTITSIESGINIKMLSPEQKLIPIFGKNKNVPINILENPKILKSRK